MKGGGGRETVFVWKRRVILFCWEENLFRCKEPASAIQ
jgi:hypothetical protein